MQLTRAADYAVRVMIHLASLPAGTRVPRFLLASATGVPESFLAKVLQELARAGLVESRRGPDGGFALIKDSTTVTLLDVLEAIEGPIRLNACLGVNTACDRSDWCAAHLVWVQAQDAMTSVLRRATLAELSKQSTARWKVFRKQNRGNSAGEYARHN